jgi:hypothetical protein
LKLDIDKVSGTEMEEAVERLYAAPPAVLDLVRKVSAVQ